MRVGAIGSPARFRVVSGASRFRERSVCLPGQDTLGDACDDEDDGDGYPDSTETGMGKNPLAYCPIMRADVDGDGAVSILDLSLDADEFNQAVPPADERLNQDGDSVISILDLSSQADVYHQLVTMCP